MIHLKVFRKCVLFLETKSSHFGAHRDVRFTAGRKPLRKPPNLPNSGTEASKSKSEILQL